MVTWACMKFSAQHPMVNHNVLMFSLKCQGGCAAMGLLQALGELVGPHRCYMALNDTAWHVLAEPSFSGP